MDSSKIMPHTQSLKPEEMLREVITTTNPKMGTRRMDSTKRGMTTIMMVEIPLSGLAPIIIKVEQTILCPIGRKKAILIIITLMPETSKATKTGKITTVRTKGETTTSLDPTETPTEIRTTITTGIITVIRTTRITITKIATMEIRITVGAGTGIINKINKGKATSNPARTKMKGNSLKHLLNK